MRPCQGRTSAAVSHLHVPSATNVLKASLADGILIVSRVFLGAQEECIIILRDENTCIGLRDHVTDLQVRR